MFWSGDNHNFQLFKLKKEKKKSNGKTGRKQKDIYSKTKLFKNSCNFMYICIYIYKYIYSQMNI